MENYGRNLDSKGQSGIFVQTSMGFDADQLETYFIHLDLKICVWQVNFGEEINILKTEVKKKMLWIFFYCMRICFLILEKKEKTHLAEVGE